jgi:hypothetical protein
VRSVWREQLVLVALAVAMSTTGVAQDVFFRQTPLDDAAARVPYDGRFAFVRLRYSGFDGFRRDAPWSHDYPRAERHFMRILQEITLLDPHVDESNIFTLDDPALFSHPVAYMSEPGFWTMSDAEVEGMRNYFRKGGFVIFDDFRGEHWDNFEQQMRRVVPEGRLIELDATNPIFHSFFEINSLEFVQLYERGLRAVFYGMFEDNDPAKRLLLVANYNNDIGEYWEFSDQGFVPIDLSNEAYKLGVNYVMYALTH